MATRKGTFAEGRPQSVRADRRLPIPSRSTGKHRNAFSISERYNSPDGHRHSYFNSKHHGYPDDTASIEGGRNGFTQSDTRMEDREPDQLPYSGSHGDVVDQMFRYKPSGRGGAHNPKLQSEFDTKADLQDALRATEVVFEKAYRAYDDTLEASLNDVLEGDFTALELPVVLFVDEKP